MSEIHVRVVAQPGQVGELSGERTLERLAERVDELGDSVAQIANDLRARLDAELVAEPESAWALNEVALSFSLDLEAEAGVVVAKAKTTAGFEAQLIWTRVNPRMP